MSSTLAAKESADGMTVDQALQDALALPISDHHVHPVRSGFSGRADLGQHAAARELRAGGARHRLRLSGQALLLTAAPLRPNKK